MNITVEKFPDCKAAIRVEVPRERVESQRTAITKFYHKGASIPGFRPGKAPAAMIVRRYAKQIEQELRDRLTAEGYQAGSKQEGLEILAPLDVKDPQFTEEGTFTFTVEVIVAPTFELPELKGIPIKLPKLSITEENLDQAILNLRERQANYPTVEGRALQLGDVAVIDYNAFIDGKPVRELAPSAPERLQESVDYWIMVKEPNFLPGFSDALVGLEAGGTRQVVLTLAADFPVKEIAGMDVTYEVTLKEVREQELPLIDDEFARSTRLADEASQLREAVRSTLERELTQKMEQSKREQLLQYLNDQIVFPVPQELLGQATQQRARELVQANQERGVPEEEILQNREQIIGAAHHQAEFDMKVRFILQKIAQKEQVAATSDEMQRELMSHAMRTKATRAQIQKLLKNQETISRLRENVITRKTVDLLLAQAVIEEVEAEAEAEAEAPAV